MKFFTIIISIVLLMSCNDSKKQLLEEKHHMEFHEEMDKISEEYQKFETILVKLYDESIQNPQKTLFRVFDPYPRQNYQHHKE